MRRLVESREKCNVMKGRRFSLALCVTPQQKEKKNVDVRNGASEARRAYFLVILQPSDDIYFGCCSCWRIPPLLTSPPHSLMQMNANKKFMSGVGEREIVEGNYCETSRKKENSYSRSAPAILTFFCWMLA